MKLLVALSAFAAVSVAGAGYFTVTSNTETGKELRSLIGMEAVSYTHLTLPTKA